jgi:hypothetical protein
MKGSYLGEWEEGRRYQHRVERLIFFGSMGMIDFMVELFAGDRSEVDSGGQVSLKGSMPLRT